MWGWCKKREDFRLFKLNRMEKVEMSEETFVKRQVPITDLSNEKIFPGGIKVKVLFEPEEIRAEIRENIERMRRNYL